MKTMFLRYLPLLAVLAVAIPAIGLCIGFTSMLPTEASVPFLLAGSVLAAVNASATKTDKPRHDLGTFDVDNAAWDDLNRERQRLETICLDYDGNSAENLEKLGADDLNVYTEAVNRLTAVQNRIDASPRGRFQQRQQVSNAVIHARNLGSQMVVTPCVDSDPTCGYGEGPAGETAMLRDVVIAYGQKKPLDTDRFKALARRTAYNRLKDKTNPAFQPEVMNAIGDDEYSFHRWQEGGLLIPKQYLSTVQQQAVPRDWLTALCFRLPMEAPELSIPCRVDKNHATSYTGGTRVYRKGETQTADKSKDAFEEISFKANELIGAAAATAMLLRYSPISIAALIREAFSAAFDFKRMEEFLYGSGSGCPLGMLAAGNASKLILNRTVGQAATTIVSGKDVLRMRLAAFEYSRCYWICNEDLLLYIAQLHIESGTNLLPITERFWTPGVDGKPDMILGRPVMTTEHHVGINTGTGGTIANWNDNFLSLVNPSAYAYGELYTEDAVSTHVRFDERETVFQFVKADDGRPMWKDYLRPTKGKTFKSPFVQLSTTVDT